MHPSALSVDFGSSYTKVAVRRGYDVQGSLLSDPVDGSGDGAIFWPSVAASVRGSWVAGWKAANLQAVPDTIVYRDWKRRLFDDPTSSETLEIARHFFAALLGAMPAAVRGLPARVCVPELEGSSQGRSVLTDTLLETGWVLAHHKPLVSEPATNLIGVLTRGANRTHVPRVVSFQRYEGRTHDLGRMFDQRLVDRFRHMTGVVRMAVVDVGAYTTDVGLVEFDATFRADHISDTDIEQVSYALGVQELDREFLEALPEEKRRAVEASSAVGWDRRKQAIYAGRAQAFALDGGRIVVGDESDQVTLGRVMRDFSNRVAEVVESFLSSKGALRGLVLTGGGMNIQGLNESVVQGLGDLRVRKVHNLVDPNEPRSSLGEGALARDIERRAVENRRLVRGGSALGACSVFWK